MKQFLSKRSKGLLLQRFGFAFIKIQKVTWDSYFLITFISSSCPCSLLLFFSELFLGSLWSSALPRVSCTVHSAAWLLPPYAVSDTTHGIQDFPCVAYDNTLLQRSGLILDKFWFVSCKCRPGSTSSPCLCNSKKIISREVIKAVFLGKRR